jgi:hypothetical protein
MDLGRTSVESYGAQMDGSNSLLASEALYHKR